MASAAQELDDFTHFAKGRIEQGSELTMDELYDEWREQRPSAEDALAIRASIRDMEAGDSGRAFDEFADEFRKRNHIPDDE